MKVLPCLILTFLLSAGPSLAQDWLTRIVRQIRNEYQIDGQFCLAAVIPAGQDPNNLINNVFQNDRFQAVSRVIGERNSANNNRGVYIGHRVIVARPKEREGRQSGEHAERRVLQALRNQLENQHQNEYKNSQGRVLLIYSFASACDTCTSNDHPSSIIGDLRHIVQTWHDSKFVFKKIFQPRNGDPIPEDNLINSLRSLGNAIGGLRNIFRCDNRCYSCALQDPVTRYCVNNNAQPPQ